MDILEEIKKQQGSMSDSKFATSIGCTRQLWQATRTGTLPLSDTILSGVANNIPALRKAADSQHHKMFRGLTSKVRQDRRESIGVVQSAIEEVKRHLR